MKEVFLSLGTNLGDKEKNLMAAIQCLADTVGIFVALSGVYKTAPWGFESKDNFLNMVIEISTDLIPADLIERCLEIETLLGRTRKETIGYSSRLIDIDVLFYSDEVIHTPRLSVPHPHLHNRKFILEPLCEIAPQMVHPIFQKSILDLLKSCSDKADVKRMGDLSIQL